jgi:hypothetical protein
MTRDGGNLSRVHFLKDYLEELEVCMVDQEEDIKVLKVQLHLCMDQRKQKIHFSLD